MENRSENNGGGGGWLSVPAFGDWDQKHGGVPDYSMDFSKIREMRKQNKKDFSRASIGNDEELINNSQHQQDNDGGGVGSHDDDLHRRGPHHRRGHSHSPTTKEKIWRYLNCCVSA